MRGSMREFSMSLGGFWDWEVQLGMSYIFRGRLWIGS